VRTRNITGSTDLKVSRIGDTAFRMFSLNKRRALLPRGDDGHGHVLGVRKRDASQWSKMQLVDAAMAILSRTLHD
jgi:hypothetical protein